MELLLTVLIMMPPLGVLMAGEKPAKVDPEGYVDVPGGKVWYRIEGADKPGIPLLVLHGGPGVPHDYLVNLTDLTDERPVIFYDQLGCGKSPAENDTTLWRIERFVEELAIVRKTLGLSRVHILGQSWGAMLCMEYMVTKPEGVVSCIFAGPCLDAQRFIADQREWLKSMPEADRSAILNHEASGTFDHPDYQAAMMNYYHRHICLMDPWPVEIENAFAGYGLDVYGYMWGASEFSMNGTLASYNRVPDLKQLDIPVLYTCGEFDEATPEAVKHFHQSTPDSEYLMIPGTAHMHHLENPTLFLGKARDFLRRAESRQRK